MLALNLTKFEKIYFHKFNFDRPNGVNIILNSSITDERKIILLSRIAHNWCKHTSAHHIIVAYTISYSDFFGIKNHIFSKKLVEKIREKELSSYIVIRKDRKIVEIK